MFEHGSAASDDLHGVLQDAHRITRVIGHSKGALAIENALRSLPPERMRSISVASFGCAIAEEQKHCGYAQFLGILDGLGEINSWGHQPEQRPLAHDSTNWLIPFSLPAAMLLEQPPPCDRRRINEGLLKATLLIAGLLAILIGLIWIGQGTGYFPYPASSFMINQMPWVYWGALLAALGLIVVLVSRRM